VEARKKDTPDGLCGDCGDPVQYLPATGKLLNMDGRSHDETHRERLRAISLEVCDALDERRSRNEYRSVELNERGSSGFKIVGKNGVTYHYHCTKMEPPKRKG
jgi:hypothetical protein